MVKYCVIKSWLKMNFGKILGSVLVIFFLVSFAESGTANCSAMTKCKSCLDYNETKCFWCDSTRKCMKKDGILPNDCKSINWRYYGNCTVPGYVWVIVLPVLGFIVLLAIACTFYCCCCRCKTSSAKLNREETKFHQKRMELKAKHAERRAERKQRTDEIRKKYGLDRDDSGGSTQPPPERSQV